jgi:plastocyanin
MTYTVDGQQYVAIASGGNRGGNITLDGDAVWAFSLNGVIDEVAAPPPIQTKATLSGPLVKLGDPVGLPNEIGGERPFDGTINMADYYFAPLRVSVPVGTALQWQNTGSVVHTATAANLTWDTGDVASGEARSITFDTAATYTYACTPHPWMLGQIVVQ